MNAHGFSRCSIVSTAATTSASPSAATGQCGRIEIDLAELRVDGKPLVPHGVEAAVAVEAARQQTPEPRAAASDVDEPPAGDASRRERAIDHVVDRVVARSEALTRARLERQRIRRRRSGATLRADGDIAANASASRRQLGRWIGKVPRPRRRGGGQRRAKPAIDDQALERAPRARPESPAGTSTPHDSSTISIAPPARDATTGRPAASAST